MAEPCAANPPRARKMQALIFQRLSELSATCIAEALGVSDATVSRMKNEQTESYTAFLAALGLKLVPESSKCFQPEYIEHLRYFARRGVELEAERAELQWDE